MNRKEIGYLLGNDKIFHTLDKVLIDYENGKRELTRGEYKRLSTIIKKIALLSVDLEFNDKVSID